jgi:hypothetical protein
VILARYTVSQCLRTRHAQAFCVFRAAVLWLALGVALGLGGPAGAIVYVDKSATGSGTGDDWANAYTTIQPGINDAFASGGDEVWVADGTYPENLVMKSGVHVYGGFAGGEATRQARDFVVNVATVNGSAAGSCLSAIGTTSGTFDGFTLTNGSGTNKSGVRYGGGAYIENCSPTIANCTVKLNSANYGGGICLLTSASPQIIHCTITQNAATDTGGGIHMATQCSPFVNVSTISYNTARTGAGLFIDAYSLPNVQANTIAHNQATNHGGGIYLRDHSNAFIEGNFIDHNSAGLNGGGIRSYSYCSPRISNNTISYNTAASYGGGLSFITYGVFELTENIIERNQSQWGAGVAVQDRTDGAIAANTIRYNTATEGGGGIYMDHPSSDVDILNNTFRTNRGNKGGGGIRLQGGVHPLIANDLFLYSRGFAMGGAILCDASSPTVANCTFVSGTAEYGGGIYCNAGSTVTVTNSIFAYNNSTTGLFGGAIWSESGTVDYTQYNLVFSNGWWHFWGFSPTGYIDADPLFMNMEYDDYHLALFSPAIDKGKNSSAISTWGDIDGETRIVDGHVGLGSVVDLGCDEAFIESTSPPAGFIDPGWNWISIPLEPLDRDAASIFGAEFVTNKLYMWDRVRKTVLLYPDDFHDLHIGEGYMLRSGVVQTPSYLGLAWHSDVYISLPTAGWSWIGHPQRSPVPLASLRVYNDSEEETRTVAQDIAAGSGAWANWNLIYWDSYRDTARIVSVANGDDDTLRPWYGYLIWTNTEYLTLIVPPE